MHSAQWLFLTNVFWHLGATVSGIGALIAGLVSRNKPKGHPKVFFAVGLVLLFVACDQAWQDEHFNATRIIEQKSEAYSQLNFWKAQSYEKDAAIRNLQDVLDGQALNSGKEVAALAGAQQSANKSQAALAALAGKVLALGAPVPLRTTVVLAYGGQKPHQKIVAVDLTNRTVTPARVSMTCDTQIDANVSARVVNGGNYIPAVVNWHSGHRTVDLAISSPAWSPTSPLVIVFSLPEPVDHAACSINPY